MVAGSERSPNVLLFKMHYSRKERWQRTTQSPSNEYLFPSGETGSSA